MNDLNLAKVELQKRNLALIFMKNSTIIYETNVGGLGGFLKAINDHGIHLVNSSVADRVIGKAAALLCIYSQVKSAYTLTLSKSGLRVLEDQGVQINYENLTPMILNTKKTGQCPFENLVKDVTDPKIAYSKIHEFYHHHIKQNTTLST
jgi:hypothetical protein